MYIYNLFILQKVKSGACAHTLSRTHIGRNLLWLLKVYRLDVEAYMRIQYLPFT